MTTLVYHGKSKCLLEYCNEKLAFSTRDNIFYLTFQNILVQSGSSVQAEGQGPWASCFLCTCGFGCRKKDLTSAEDNSEVKDIPYIPPDSTNQYIANDKISYQAAEEKYFRPTEYKSDVKDIPYNTRHYKVVYREQQDIKNSIFHTSAIYFKEKKTAQTIELSEKQTQRCQHMFSKHVQNPRFQLLDKRNFILWR